jgi:hypothetical protein
MALFGGDAISTADMLHGFLVKRPMAGNDPRKVSREAVTFKVAIAVNGDLNGRFV